MEYVFGTVQRGGVTRESLKVVGGPSLAVGEFVTIVREYDNCTITDRCRVVEHYHTENGPDGVRYDFYVIGDHYRDTDRTKAVAATQQATEIAFVVLAEGGSIDAVTAGEHRELFASWEAGVAYAVGQYRNSGEKLYRCVQAHTSQEGWEPENTPALWAVAADPAEEWPAWSQPLGAQDAYAKGAKVSHGGKHWISDVAANVWEPGVYGWTEAADG